MPGTTGSNEQRTEQNQAQAAAENPQDATDKSAAAVSFEEPSSNAKAAGSAGAATETATTNSGTKEGVASNQTGDEDDPTNPPVRPRAVTHVPKDKLTRCVTCHAFRLRPALDDDTTTSSRTKDCESSHAPTPAPAPAPAPRLRQGPCCVERASLRPMW